MSNNVSQTKDKENHSWCLAVLKGAIKSYLTASKIGSAVQIQNVGGHCFSHPILLRLNTHAGCQIEDTLYPSFNMPLVIDWKLRLFRLYVRFDPVRLLAFMAAIHSVFHQLAIQCVTILLGKLVVSGITQTKTKTDIPTRNSLFNIE